MAIGTESKDRHVVYLSLHDSSYYDREKDQIMVTFGRKVYDFVGRYTGMILIDFSPASLIKLSDAFLLETKSI